MIIIGKQGKNGRSEILTPYPKWPMFRNVGQWDNNRKIFIPYEDAEYTLSQLDSIVAYLKKHSANG